MVIYDKLERIQELLWKNDDRLDQDTLFNVQDAVAELIFDVAKEEGQLERLVTKFPFLYRRAES